MRAFSESTRQTILAVLVGPLSIIPAMFVAQTLIFIISPTNPLDIAEQYWGGFLIAAIGLLYSYGFTFLYGVPVYVVLKKLRLDRAIYILVTSLVPAVVFFIMLPDAWPIYLAMAYFSVIVGFSCWFITLRGGKQGSNNQLNQDAPNSGAPVS